MVNLIGDYKQSVLLGNLCDSYKLFLRPNPACRIMRRTKDEQRIFWIRCELLKKIEVNIVGKVIIQDKRALNKRPMRVLDSQIEWMIDRRKDDDTLIGFGELLNR